MKAIFESLSVTRDRFMTVQVERVFADLELFVIVVEYHDKSRRPKVVRRIVSHQFVVL